MFTGLVQAVGQVRTREAGRLAVEAAALPEIDRVRPGDSIAVNGVCLTVVAVEGTRLCFDLGPETLARTNLGRLSVADGVNLELALRLSDRLGGHLVSGHVDAAVPVLGIVLAADGCADWRFGLPAPLARYVAVKGSVSVDGVSLTVTQVDGSGFAVMLIPHTLAHTRFRQLRAGDLVNLEVDLLARHLERLIASGSRACEPSTWPRT